MAKRRSAAQVERDRRRISELYLKGWLQVDIAQAIGLDQSTVSRDLSTIQGQWRESTLIDFDEAKAREIAKIDNLEITYWQAWEHSLEQFRSKTIKAKGADPEAAKASAEQTLKTEDRNGNSRYLDGVQWCIDRRIKLFGLDEPIKIDWRERLPEGFTEDDIQRQFAELLQLAAENANDND